MTDEFGIFTRQLEHHAESYFQARTVLMGRLQNKFVYPLCESRGWRFSAGMGVWCFWIPENDEFWQALRAADPDSTEEFSAGIDEVEETLKLIDDPELEQAFNALTYPCPIEGTHLGIWFDDYDPSEDLL